MDDQPLFDELLQAAARLRVAVRIEPFETPATPGWRPVYRPGRDARVDRPARATAGSPPCPRSGAPRTPEGDRLHAPEARELIETVRDDWNPHIECTRAPKTARLRAYALEAEPPSFHL